MVRVNPLSRFRVVKTWLWSYPPAARAFLFPMAVLMLLAWPVIVLFGLLDWLFHMVIACLARIPPLRWLASLFRIELWTVQPRPIPHAYDLLHRMRLARRVLFPLMIVEWSALLVLGTAAGITCLTEANLMVVAGSAFIVVVGSGFPVYALSSWYRHLLKDWKNEEALHCPDCGYNRIFTGTLRCPECGSRHKPLRPGTLPPPEQKWALLSDESNVFLPIAMIGSLGPLLAALHAHVSVRLTGLILVGLTVSTACLCALALARLIRATRKDRFIPPAS